MERGKTKTTLGSRRSPARSPEAAQSARAQGPKPPHPASTASPPPQHGNEEKNAAPSQRSAHQPPPPPPPSAAVVVASLPSCAADSDVVVLLRHPLVRDLVRENEEMLMELAAMRGAHRQRIPAQQQQILCGEERAARAAVVAAELEARAAWAAQHNAALARRVALLEKSLVEEEAKTEELMACAKLAQAQLDSSPRANPVTAAHGSASEASSPAIKKPRFLLRDSGGVSAEDAESRRPSLQEITNVRGTVKRLRSVDSSESGTPREALGRHSGGQRSPDALTKVRKTMH